MTSKKFDYRGFAKVKQIFLQVSGVLAIFLFSGLGIFFFSSATQFPTINHSIHILDDPRVVPGCIGVWSVLVSWAIGSVLLNSLPTIWAAETGIFVSTFLIFRRHILWEDLIDLCPLNKPFSSYYLIRAHKITAFHRFIGWHYSRTIFPGFLINKEIADREELLLIIRQHTKKMYF